MTPAFELVLADSELATIERLPSGCMLTLSAAAVRRHEPGGRVTRGHVKGVRLVLEGAHAPDPVEGEGDAAWLGGIKDGGWTVDGQVWRHLSGQTPSLGGPGTLHLSFHRGEPFEMKASALSLIWPDGALFHESLAC